MFEALFEREAELVSLAGVVEAAWGGRGGYAWVEGPPGIGKTSLLTAASELGYERGMRVLSARGGELEREFPFGVVRQLFESVVVGLDDAARERVVDAAAALAAPALGFALSERGGMRISDPASATLHGLYWLTSNLSADRPLVVAVSRTGFESSLRAHSNSCPNPSRRALTVRCAICTPSGSTATPECVCLCGSTPIVTIPTVPSSNDPMKRTPGGHYSVGALPSSYQVTPGRP
jgi:hypothetical protein